MATTTIQPTSLIRTVGVAGTGSEETVVLGIGIKRAEVFALAEDLTLSTLATGTGAVATSTTIPAGTGMLIMDRAGGMTSTFSVYILQATSDGTAQFTVST